MSNFEVKVQRIFIRPHNNADALELGNIGSPDGWQVVVKKGQYETGDLVAYIGENAVVPEWVLKKYGFWNTEKDIGMLAGSKGNRVKAVRLRGEFSLGICIPNEEVVSDDYTAVLGLEGENVADILGVTKYEPPIPTQLTGEVFNLGQHLTVDYDIENIKNYPNVLVEGEEVQVTEKIHGCADYHTLIDTIEFGQIKIGKIVEEKLDAHVKAFDVVTNEIVYNKIIGHSAQPNNLQWFELETEDGYKVKLTGNHLVWLPKLNCYREVEKLQDGDEFLIDE
ncbi:MAG: hypothetical protein QXN55_00415 [Candidatus Nitrosotenuis sp.]